MVYLLCPWRISLAFTPTLGSDVLFMQLPGQPTVIVNSLSAAVELIEFESSDRYALLATRSDL